ncbi:MAG: hypothetical protein ACUVX9_02240 [Anaerolineae bacterium]
MGAEIELQQVTTRRALEAFIRFPWEVYRNDSNWVPPILSERRAYLNPAGNPLLRRCKYALFLAQRKAKVVGTIAVLHGLPLASPTDEQVGRFGFFECLDDLAVARRLLDAARQWLRRHGAQRMRGPFNLTDQECPGVLVQGADCPPVMLAAHTPLYYREFLERCGMDKFDDLYAWRAFRHQIGTDLEHVPELIRRVAQFSLERGVTVRKVRPERWEEEVRIARHLFNVTLRHLPQHVDLSEEGFRRLADPLRRILDPDLALIAEVEGQPVGFCVSLPDINRALIHLNGRLWPTGWVRLWWHARRVRVLTFKLMGVLPEYRMRGIDALLFVSSLRAMVAKGYEWLDGSLTSERNIMVNLLAERFGAERYKHYRIYEMAV